MVEFSLAGIVLLIATIAFTDLPQPYPTWPTIEAVPINPELVVPALLGLAVLLGSITDGLSIGSIVTGVLGAITLWMATTSLYTLYIAETGGVFWGGFFTLISGVVLAVVVIVWGAVRQGVHHRISHQIRNQFDS